MFSVTCRFCHLPIQRSRVTPHYRRQHKADDLRSFNPSIEEEVATELDIMIERVVSESASESTSENTSESMSESESESESERSESKSESNDCIMCLESHDTCLFPCNHTSSCRNCLLSWWRQSYYSPRCPMCRVEVEEIYDNGVIDTITLRFWQRWREQRLGGNRRNRMPSFI
uniref:RING-type domain-containing protein n=1 Tax=viral metagenome TaxID=1070528 RepID=A0A6C0ELY1_9ZZZZ